MEKKYTEIHFDMGCNLDEVVLGLVDRAKNGQFVSCECNGVILYSDTVSMDSAYLAVTGKSYFDSVNYVTKLRASLIAEEEEHKKQIPELTKIWIEKGHAILPDNKWLQWDEWVPDRLNDLYNGEELGACLDIIEAINNKSLEDAVIVMHNQGHSGMSWGLVKLMVKTFSDRGEEFIALLGD